MSDRIEEISKHYRKNVLEQSHSTVLYTIDECPEFEAEHGMWSTALDAIATALRYLTPSTLITIFWGQQNFLYKLLKRFDAAFRSLLYSSDEQKHSVLQWVSDAGTVRVDKLETVWRHGWIVCGILDIALPGACTGHPPTKCSLKHAQSIAEDYLGVEPTFSNQELEAFDTFGKHHEWKLITFLDKIRLALEKLTAEKAKLAASKTLPEDNQYIFDYIARGSGLIAAQLNNKASFKIYPLAQQSSDPGEISIRIQGPENAYGMTTIPPILGKAQQIRQNLLGQSKSNYIENILPITQGAAYLRSYGKIDISKTYYIPPTNYTIEIETENQEDHVKISYSIYLEGKYQISITSKNQNIPGSPFSMTATKNIISHLEKDSFCLEDGEEIDIVDITTERKVILRIVDFVTEKMLLRENGLLEKISEDEAKQIMESEIIENKYSDAISDSKMCERTALDYKHSKLTLPKLYHVVNKIKLMIRGCKAFKGYERKPRDKRAIEKRIRHQKDIPDIVNSTFNDNYNNKDFLPEIRDRYIIPENISVSLLTEIPEDSSVSVNVPNSESLFKLCKQVMFSSESIKNYNALSENMFDDDNVSIETVNSTNNPFIHDTYDHNYEIEKKFGSFNVSEYETNNSQNEETQSALTKLLSDNKHDMITQSTNPFADIDNLESTVSLLNNINPFLLDEHSGSCHETLSTDFIIGAPVSLPPIITSSPSDTSTAQIDLGKTNLVTSKVIKTPKNKLTGTPVKVTSDSSTVNDFFKSNENLYKSSDLNLVKTRASSISPKSEMWDSAYVSIDETNSSSEMNTESIARTSDKQKTLLQEKFTNIESIQRELWKNANDPNIQKKDDITKLKFESKRSIFTPIREENDKNYLVEIKRNYRKECDSVTDAFAEIDDMYEDYFSTSESNSTTPYENNIIQSEKIDFAIRDEVVYVDSASEISADVKRQTKKFEGKISEVQANVTESLSASQALLKQIKRVTEDDNIQNNVVTQFGDTKYSNIVLEKKKYWDEKIQQIEAKSEALKLQQNKKRIFSKHMRRNDSLSKRKGRKIVEHFLNSNELDLEKETDSTNKDINSPTTFIEITNNSTQLMDDDRNSLLCHTTKQNDTKTIYDKDSSDIEQSLSKETQKNSKEIGETPLQLKQELSDQVFKAFETSPKRFFGTSRQHILNKIDTFLGKPNIDDCNKKNISDISHETGLVSSRISLFHDISNTEPLPKSGNKFKHIQQNKLYNHNKSSDANEVIENGSSMEDVKTNFEAVKKEIINVSCKDQKTKPTKFHSFNSFESETKSLAKTIQNDNNIEINKNIKQRHISFTESNEDKIKTTFNNNLKAISKSEMDIFNKISAIENNDFEKHKSYDELPKVSVKSFISLFEDVSKHSKNKQTQSVKKSPRFHKKLPGESLMEGTSTNNKPYNETLLMQSTKSKLIGDSLEKNVDGAKPKLKKNKSCESVSTNSTTDCDVMSYQDKESNSLGLSDVEIEIIDTPDDLAESSNSDEKTDYVDYKNRFKLAKQYFQSLEELRTEKKPRLNKGKNSSVSNESLENKSKIKKSNIKKSHTMPSSEISKIWSQMHEQKDTLDDNRRLVKISEKFNVDDLFEDVMDGRLSRQGSLRGIPHKKAVLETFRSMENVCDKKLNSYELAVSQESNFVQNKVKNAQTYLNEYPYLPTTDPSQYHSRLDADASGLITFKELLKTKPRRNSVPDIRVNPLFSVDF